MKRRHSLYILFLLCASTCLGSAQVKPAEDIVAKPTNTRESLLIGPGDLLHITVFREPDLEQKVRVKDSGEIDLDLAGTVKLSGLTPHDAAKAIAQLYMQNHFLNHPQVSVFIEEYATQSISVLGQVNKPGAFTVTTMRSLLDVLAMSGGLTEMADRHITIQRADHSGNIVVFLPNNPPVNARAAEMVYPGDTVLVPKAGIVYVLGDVGRPGGYIMQDDSNLTVMQAVALAAGANRTAKEDAARLIRKVNGSYQESAVPLRDIEKGKKPDMQLEADDVLYVPFSMAKDVVLGTSNILSSTSSAAIYAAR
ncbi:polysaccharide biosynthesis/export family protein [Alloacidobacterium sp.]|uniref:polysaccharide biosynthesis/export family protein n=1 Tax=Alloacidobacterium sp. TaxID=2951999 RepID=UPI002D23ADD2|nr:polysaccharide biosynthesis/export family protein [Alloacidobacterium sp.]HYK35333.1 polysaccharide biosynthesis/export family protein [Alloacidobacterium sp.]